MNEDKMKQNTKHFVKSFSFFSKVNLRDYDAQIADSFHSNGLKLGFGKKFDHSLHSKIVFINVV